MPPAFQDTTVPAEKSKAELSRLLTKYGADLPTFGWVDERTEFVGFRYRGRFYRFDVPHPPPGQNQATARAGASRADQALFERYAKGRYDWPEYVGREVRRRWRVLLLLIVKPLLELAEEAPEHVELMMLPYVVQASGGATVGQALRAEVARMYETGQDAEFRVLPDLPALGAGA